MPAAAPRPCPAPGCGKLLRLGTQCPDHPRNWGKQDKKRGNRHERGYGNDWVKLRAQVMLRDKGLCQPCLGLSRYTQATEVDHITPKAQGGTDDQANLQAICFACHSAKTAYESSGKNAAPLPEWLPPPRIPVVVIAGPPCSGKLDAALKMAGPNDLVIDFQQIASRLLGIAPPPYKAEPAPTVTPAYGLPGVAMASANTVEGDSNQANHQNKTVCGADTTECSRLSQAYNLDKQARTNIIRTRNALLASLASAGCSYSRAILTVTAGKPEHREWWRSKLNATLVVMDAPKELCKTRLRAMALPAVRELELMKAIDAWR